MQLPQPDFNRLLTVFHRQGEPDRVPLIELGIDIEIMEAFLGEPILRAPLDSRTARQRALDAVIRFWYQAGYDHICLGQVMNLPMKRLLTDDTAATLRRDRRSWVDQSAGVIASWADLEQYPWPYPEDVDYSDLEYVSRHLPDGMKVIFEAEPGGQLEIAMWLMGYATFAITLKEDPALVAAVTDRVGEMLTNYCSVEYDDQSWSSLCLPWTDKTGRSPLRPGGSGATRRRHL